jgi:hypothetical protein
MVGVGARFIALASVHIPLERTFDDGNLRVIKRFDAGDDGF